MIGTTAATFPFRYHLLRANRLLFYGVTQYIVLSAVLIAMVITATTAVKAYLKRRRAYKEKIDCFVQTILSWLQHPDQFYELGSGNNYPPFMPSTAIPVDSLRAELMYIDSGCSAEDWNQVVKLVHKNPNVLRTIHGIHGQLMECWELARSSYIPQRPSILQTIVNRFFK